MLNKTNLIKKIILIVALIASTARLYGKSKGKADTEEKNNSYTLCPFVSGNGAFSNSSNESIKTEELDSPINDLKSSATDMIKIINDILNNKNMDILNQLSNLNGDFSIGQESLVKIYQVQSEIISVIYDKLKNFHSDTSFDLSVAYIPKEMCDMAVRSGESAVRGSTISRSNPADSTAGLNPEENNFKSNFTKYIDKTPVNGKLSLVGFTLNFNYLRGNFVDSIAQMEKGQSPFEIIVSGGFILRLPDDFKINLNKNLNISDNPADNYIVTDLKFKDGEDKPKLALVNFDNLTINMNGLSFGAQKIKSESKNKNIKENTKPIKLQNENFIASIEFTDSVDYIKEHNTRNQKFYNKFKDEDSYFSSSTHSNPLVATILRENCYNNPEACSKWWNPLNEFHIKVDQLIIELRPKNIIINYGSKKEIQRVLFPFPRAPEKNKNEHGWIALELFNLFGLKPEAKLNDEWFSQKALVNKKLELLADELFSGAAARASVGLSIYNFIQNNICKDSPYGIVKMSYPLDSLNSSNVEQINCNDNINNFLHKTQKQKVVPEE